MRRLLLGREEGGRVTGKDGCGGAWSVFRGDALDAYALWPAPSIIISDGAYGVGGFPGDPRTADGLVDWYEPHVESWAKHARLSSTLWFWNTELGWATVHPLLVSHGWGYIQTVVWDETASTSPARACSSSAARWRHQSSSGRPRLRFSSMWRSILRTERR